MPNFSPTDSSADVQQDWTRVQAVVIGAGITGAGAALGLLKAGAAVTVFTDQPDDRTIPLVELGAQAVVGASTVPANTSLVVPSQTVRPHHQLLVSAGQAGAEIISEVELAWRLRNPANPAPWLALTGTNGKTTTVGMLAAILTAAGHRTIATGNVGKSVVETVLAQPPYDVLAVELSSFQLHWTSTIKPLASAVLNLAPDHLDWHGSLAAYGADKARIWGGDISIGNDDDPAVVELRNQAQPANWVGFTLKEPGPGQLGVHNGYLIDNAFSDRPQRIAPVTDVRPTGEHNVANALAASALALAYGVSVEAIQAGLQTFVPGDHRNQLVRTVNGVTYINDSKATNPHAASASLSAYPRVVWIAGGQLKGADITDLVKEIHPRLVGVVLIGADFAMIADVLSRHAPNVPVVHVDRTDDEAMTDIVNAATQLASPGDSVLLAPAAASFDMFANYASRGEKFAAAVHKLEGE